MKVSMTNGSGKWADRPRETDKGTLPVRFCILSFEEIRETVY
jgi:hypothetical protein